MKKTFTLLPTLILALLLATGLLHGCAAQKQAKNLDIILAEYEKSIRWSQWDAAVEFLAPEYLETNAPTPLDLDRLRLFRVTGYETRSAVPFDEGMGFRQTVEIRMFNKNQAIERTLRDVQEWKYDADLERWFLHSGLPDVTKAR
jgi:hypothetical protein